MNIERWDHYYKIDPEYNSRVGNNMLYTPYINKDRTIMCQSWDHTNPYQKPHKRPDFTEKLIDYFFVREVEHFTRYKNKSWCPEIYDIDFSKKRIYLEFPGETLNDVAYMEGRGLDVEIPNWREQVFDIIKDIYDNGYMKLSLYPHCFYVSKQTNRLKTFDFYPCISRKNPYIPITDFVGMIGNDSTGRFKEAIEGDNINFNYFFERILSTHVKWPTDPFPEFHKRLFGDRQ